MNSEEISDKDSQKSNAENSVTAASKDKNIIPQKENKTEDPSVQAAG